jgi:hypothetical protein
VFRRRRMRYAARQTMERVAMEPRTIPAMTPPDRALLEEPGEGDVLVVAARSVGNADVDIELGDVADAIIEE